MQPVQVCLCRAVLFQGFFCNKYIGCLSYFIAFKVYNREDIRQVSFLDNITGSRSEFKSLTCINRNIFVGSVTHALDYWGGYVFVSVTSHVLWTIVPAVCGEQNFFFFS